MSETQGSRRVPRHHHANDGRADREASTSGAEGFAALGLSDQTLAAVKDMGHTVPTPVQAQSIPLTLAGRDVLAAAQTGTGKTAAFLLPTLDRLSHAGRGEGPLMLVVTPTRELAQQIDGVAQVICKHTHHKVTTVVGGVSYEPQKSALRHGCDVLVATPGRLEDLIAQGAANLSHVEVLVLDEADRMLDMGFLPAVKRIAAKTPQSRQTLLFSATLDEDAQECTAGLVKNPACVEIARRGSIADTIDQFILPVSAKAKNNLLIQLLKREGSQRVIVFCRGKHRADGICRRLRKAGITCAPIHGNRSQKQRENALRNFRSGDVDVLVATDVLARGIDIPEVSYVVNFDVPGEAEDYIHRIGRTGRAGESGWALTFVTEDDYLDLRDAEQLMKSIVPLYQKTDGLDQGEDLPKIDPHRDPLEKLPGKKARKKMAEAREARRKAQEGKVALQDDAKSQGNAKSQSGTQKRSSERGNRKRERGGKRLADRTQKPRRKSGGEKRGPSRANEPSGRAVQKFGPAGKPTAKPKRLKRHPGDRGGRR